MPIGLTTVVSGPDKLIPYISRLTEVGMLLKSIELNFKDWYFGYSSSKHKSAGTRHMSKVS